MKRPLLILKTGRTLDPIREVRGDFEDWIADRMRIERSEIVTVEVHDGEALPPPDEVGAVVVTGSAAMVTDRAPWSVSSGQWLVRAIEHDIPTLGICYGHQLLADALGGTVGVNPRGREIGTIAVELTEEGQRDRLLSSIAAEPRFQATHLEAVLTLPPGAVRLAQSEQDPNQAYRVGSAWGVQFHPEFDAAIVRGYVEARREQLAVEGLDPDRINLAAEDTPHGEMLLARFATLCGQGSDNPQDR
jgi:GMP synthase (glutamine-hydrolysing)